MSDDPACRPASIDSTDLVRRLWDDVRRAAEAPFVSAVPELGERPAMVYDSDLARLNAESGAGDGGVTGHLVALLNTLAERHDELVVELRQLREAIKSEAERLAERDDTLHRALETQIQSRCGSDGSPS